MSVDAMHDAADTLCWVCFLGQTHRRTYMSVTSHTQANNPELCFVQLVLSLIVLNTHNNCSMQSVFLPCDIHQPFRRQCKIGADLTG